MIIYIFHYLISQSPVHWTIKMRRVSTSVHKGSRAISFSYTTSHTKQTAEKKNLKDIGRKNLFMTTRCDNPRIYNPRRSAVQQFMALPGKTYISTDRFVPMQVNNLLCRLDAPEFPTFDDVFSLAVWVNSGKDPKQITFETITGSNLFREDAEGINGLNMLLWTIFTHGPVDIKMAIDKTDQIVAMREHESRKLRGAFR